MTSRINDRVRKSLWAHSGNLCAMCHSLLVLEARQGCAITVIGEECHIVAQSASGARGEFLGGLNESQIDAFDNLILLCPNDHKLVDSDPTIYTIAMLREIKVQHMTFVAQNLSFKHPNNSPQSHGKKLTLTPLPKQNQPLANPQRTGVIKSLLVHCHEWNGFDRDEGMPKSAINLVVDLSNYFEVFEIFDDIPPGICIEVEEACSSLIAGLLDLHYVVYGNKVRRHLLVQSDPPSNWISAFTKVIHLE